MDHFYTFTLPGHTFKVQRREFYAYNTVTESNINELLADFTLVRFHRMVPILSVCRHYKSKIFLYQNDL